MSRILGQEKLLCNIDNLVNSGNFPRYLMIVGPRGSGKYLVSKYIANKLKARFVLIEPKIDSVRECIKLAYEQNEPTLYYIPKTDKMSIGAKNALLKVTEEPPQKAYFIMSLQDRQNTLSTLLSRGTVIELQSYDYSTLKEYYINCLGGKENDPITNVINYCITPGDVYTIVNENVNCSSLKNLCEKVVTSISKASGGNALKISHSLRYKTYEEEPDKFDINLFMNGVIQELFKKIHDSSESLENKKVYSKAIIVTSKYRQQLNITGINKLATVDQWILNLRKTLMEVC